MGSKPKAPDNSAAIEAAEKREREAQENADRLARESLNETNARRRQRRGKSLLIATSEMGVQESLGK